MRWLIVMGFLLWAAPVQAGVPANVPVLDDVALQKFLKSLSDHLNTLECLTADPNGSVLGTHGELKCAVFTPTGSSTSSHHICMNTSTGPSKGTGWTCVNIESIASPTTGIFCGGTISTTTTCEEFRGRIPVPCTIQRVDATVTTAPTGQSILVDVNECSAPNTCTSIWSTTPANRLTIAANALTASQTSFDDTSIAQGNYIGFDVDQVGSTVAGKNLTVTLVCQ